MSRPLWGKGDRASGGRGELALNLRLPPNLTTKPNSPRKQNRTKSSLKQPIDPEVVVIVVVACSIRGVGWRREFPLNHSLKPLKIQGAI